MQGGTESEDRLLDGRVRLIQPATGYRVAIDPVLLAAACPARPGERVVDFGCGSGAALLALASRVPDLDLTGLEIDSAMADLARRNLALNRWDGRIVEADVEDRAAVVSAFPRPPDHIIANPPYWSPRQGTPSPDAARRQAHAGGNLSAWIASARELVNHKGWLTLILPAARWAEAAAHLAGFGAVALIPLWPRTGQPAKRVIVRARKGVRSPSEVVPGLTLHRSGGGYTSDADAILRDGQALAPLRPSG